MCRASVFEPWTSANSALYSPLGKMHDGLVIIVLDQSQDSCPLML